MIVARQAPGIVGPYMLALGRWAIAAALLAGITAPELWRERSHLRRTWGQYLLLGFLGMLVCGAWVYEGARSTEAVNMALIYAASPVLIALGSVWWLGERFAWHQALGVLMAMSGVLHVIVRGHWSSLGTLRFVPGDGWILAATFSWAAFALLQKRWPSPLGPTARLAAMCLGGVAVLLPCALWELSRPGPDPFTGHAMLMMVALALVPGVMAYGIYGWAQRLLGASRVAVTLYLGPLYTALGGWLVLGEALGWHHLMGGGLILLGVYLVTRKPGSR